MRVGEHDLCTILRRAPATRPGSSQSWSGLAVKDTSSVPLGSTALPAAWFPTGRMDDVDKTYGRRGQDVWTAWTTCMDSVMVGQRCTTASS